MMLQMLDAPRHEDLMRMRQLLAEAEAKLRLTQRRCGAHGQANEAPSPLHAHPQPPQLQSVPEYNPPAETGTSSHLKQLEGRGQLFYASGTARPRAERDLSAFTAHFPDQYLRCDIQSVCMPPPSTMAIPCHAKPRRLTARCTPSAHVAHRCSAR